MTITDLDVTTRPANDDQILAEVGDLIEAYELDHEPLDN